MAETVNVLSARALLCATYDLLSATHAPKQIAFDTKVLSEIADDSDYHRTKKGYMGYRTAGIFRFGNKRWAIARGEKCGAYPAEPFDSDLIALEVTVRGSRKIPQTLAAQIQYGRYFANTILFAMADGKLFIPEEGRFTRRMNEVIPKLNRFEAQPAEYDRSCIALSTLRHPATKCAQYRSDCHLFLAEAIEDILQSLT